MDVAEELASAYGVLPQMVMRLPWVHVAELWQSFTKRQRRQLKYEMALHGADVTKPEDGLTKEQISELVAGDFPVTFVKV